MEGLTNGSKKEHSHKPHHVHLSSPSPEVKSTSEPYPVDWERGKAPLRKEARAVHTDRTVFGRCTNLLSVHPTCASSAHRKRSTGEGQGRDRCPAPRTPPHAPPPGLHFSAGALSLQWIGMFRGVSAPGVSPRAVTDQSGCTLVRTPGPSPLGRSNSAGVFPDGPQSPRQLHSSCPLCLPAALLPHLTSHSLLGLPGHATPINDSHSNCGAV